VYLINVYLNTDPFERNLQLEEILHDTEVLKWASKKREIFCGGDFNQVAEERVDAENALDSAAGSAFDRRRSKKLILDLQARLGMHDIMRVMAPGLRLFTHRPKSGIGVMRRLDRWLTPINSRVTWVKSDDFSLSDHCPVIINLELGGEDAETVSAVGEGGRGSRGARARVGERGGKKGPSGPF
jgi:exonuclease III